MQSLCCSQRLLNLHPPPPPPPPPSSFSPRNFFLTLRGRSGRIRFGNPIQGRLRATRVMSYLPYLPDSSEPSNTVSPPPDSRIRDLANRSISNLARSPGASTRWDSFRGKSGAVSFCGLTHQTLDERKLINSPFKEDTGSFVWVLGPVALLSSLLLPQFFLGGVIEGFVKDMILAEIVVSLTSEFIFYVGLAAFLSTTDHVQRPYLEFSSKRWSLITGLRGYLSTAFFIMGFKVFAPFMAAYVVWPVIGLPALIAVAPYLLGCAAQYAFELHLEKRRSSCWPLLPIIFEMYRVYQLSKAAHFIEMLMFSLRDSPISPLVMERSGALTSMLAVLQVLGIVCLWSLITFLLRLFPSRPVAENY